MDRQYFLHGFCFHKNAAFNQQIKAERFIANKPLILNLDNLLRGTLKASKA
jgi:hypothetical protein